MDSVIPKEMQGIYNCLAPAITVFCEAQLDARYLEKCLAALEKLCRKRPSPLLSGNLNTWAAGIMYFVCAQNDRFVCGCKNRLDAAEVAGFFGLSVNTASTKASQIRKMFRVKTYNERCWSFDDGSDDPWRVDPPM